MERDKFEKYIAGKTIESWDYNTIKLTNGDTVEIDRSDFYGDSFEIISKQPKTIWQRSTKSMPDVWITSSDDEYETGKHLTKFTWRRKEME